MPPGDALPRAGYRAMRWLVYQVSGELDDGVTAEQVARHSCEQLLDPAFSEVGVHRRGGQAWLLFAAPFSPPSVADAPAVAQRVLDLVNATRGTARTCGERRFERAGPLRASLALERAAYAHAQDMSAGGFVAHQGSDGSTPLIRATRAGYAARSVGENLAAGQATAEAAVEAWVNSPAHCANLMNPAFAEMGIAFVVNLASPSGIYWAQVLGRPH